MDDIIVFSKTINQHIERLAGVFECLRCCGLKLKPQKCFFGEKKITYLGHIISEEGIAPSTTKSECIKNLEHPKNQKEVKQFLGLTGYFRRFVKNYAIIAEPLHRLLRKNTKFGWNDEQQKAFEEL